MLIKCFEFIYLKRSLCWAGGLLGAGVYSGTCWLTLCVSLGGNKYVNNIYTDRLGYDKVPAVSQMRAFRGEVESQKRI